MKPIRLPTTIGPKLGKTTGTESHGATTGSQTCNDVTMTTDGARPGRPRLTRGEVTVVVAGALLVLDLLVAPWHRFAIDVSELKKFGIEVPSFRLDRRGVQDPQAFFGIASAIIAIIMVIQVVAAKLTPAMPRVEQLHLVAGAVVLGLLVAKLLANDDFLGFGAWIGVALGAALAYGGFLLSQESAAGTGRRVSSP